MTGGPDAEDRSSRSIPRRVWTSAGWLIAGRVVGSACTVATLFLLAGTLDGAAFGRLTFWIALFLVLDGLVDFGSGQVLVGKAAAEPGTAGSYLRAARRMRVGVGLLVVAAVGGAGLAMERDEAGFLALAALYQLSHVLELSTLGWRDRIAWRSPVLVRAGASLTSLAFVLLLHATGEARALPYLVAIAAGSTLGNVGLHLFGRRGLPDTEGQPIAPLGPFVRASIPIGAAAVCQQLYFHIDNVFVRAYAGDEVVGHYNVSVRIMSLAIMGGVFAASAALPWLARAHGRGDLWGATMRLTAASGSLGLVVSLGLFPWRRQLLGVFGPEFESAEASLGWLLGAAWAVHLGAPLLTAVVAAGRGRMVLMTAGLGLALNIGGNLALVPHHGMEGAAAATLATEAWVVLASLRCVWSIRRGNPVTEHAPRTP